MMNNLTINEVTLIQTCGACPEQYDAYINDKQVGYLRLRHGHFRVDYPECGGITIYQAEPQGDGCFDFDEREYYLEQAKVAILKEYNRENGASQAEEGMLINNWNEAIGLTIVDIKEFTIDMDDPAEFTIITFSNGKFAIQRDQSYYTTSCGLLDKDDAKRYIKEIEEAQK